MKKLLVLAFLACAAAFVPPSRTLAASVAYTQKDDLTGRSNVVTDVDLAGLATVEQLDAAIASIPDLQRETFEAKADRIADLYVNGAATNSLWVCGWGENRVFAHYADIEGPPQRSVWGAAYEGLTYYPDTGSWLLHVYEEGSIFENSVVAPAGSESLDFGSGFTLSRRWLYEQVRLDNPVVYSNDLAAVRAELESDIASARADLSESADTSLTSATNDLAAAIRDEISASAATVMESVSANAAAIASNAGRISTLESDVASCSGTILANAAAISANTASITANATAISGNAAAIAANSASIATNAAAIASNAEATATVSSNLTVSVSALEGAIAATSNSVPTTISLTFDGIDFDLSNEDATFASLTNIIMRLGGTYHE